MESTTRASVGPTYFGSVLPFFLLEEVKGRVRFALRSVGAADGLECPADDEANRAWNSFFPPSVATVRAMSRQASTGVLRMKGFAFGFEVERMKSRGGEAFPPPLDRRLIEPASR